MPEENQNQTTTLPATNEKNRQIINLSGDTVAEGLRVYEDESQRSVLSWFYHYVKDNNLSWQQATKAIDTSTTTLYRVWRGDYRNPNTGDLVDITDLCDRIRRYKQIVDERDGLNRLPYIETSVWGRVDKLCREVLTTQTIGFIYGEPQIGKTEALKEHARRNNHGQTIYVLMPASGGVQAMMKAIAASCHISSETCFENLRQRVTSFFDENKLLIIDEVHEVFVSYHKGSMMKCLSVLRQLQEATGCGMVLCGTNVFRDQLERGEFSQALKQLRKRGIWELQLESVPADQDLITISANYRLPTPTKDIWPKIRTIADAFGLGKYIKYLNRAHQHAKRKNQRFGWEHFFTIYAISIKLTNPVKTNDNKNN